MFSKCISAFALAGALAAAATPAVAHAQSRDWYDGYNTGWYDGYGEGEGDGYNRGHYDGYNRSWYEGHRTDRYYRSSYDWDDDYVERRSYRVSCRRSEGTGGLVIGALAGGLLGREVSRDRTAGAIIGGGVGALAGRALDRGSCR